MTYSSYVASVGYVYAEVYDPNANTITVSWPDPSIYVAVEVQYPVTYRQAA
jgi:hypothetical protein